MLNSININEELNAGKLKDQIGIAGVTTNPINPYKNTDKNLLIDETAISNEAVNLYQKEQDVKQFVSLVTSNPEDLSQEDIVAGLFSKGISDPFSVESAESLSNNQKLLDDLGL